MLTAKRLLVAIVTGFLCACVCLALASSSPGELQGPIVFQILASRTLIGVAIGISAFSFVHWSLHGLLMGMLFSIPLAASGLMAPDNPEFSKTAMFVTTVVLGMVYGLVIEFVTTVVFQSPMRPGKPAA